MLITLLGNLGMLGSVVADDERIDICVQSLIITSITKNSIFSNVYADSVISAALNYGSEIININEDSVITFELNLNSKVNQCS